MLYQSIFEISIFLLLVIGFIFENKIADVEKKLFFKIREALKK